MPLVLHRHPDLACLVARLAANLLPWPTDPFAAVPIVVGSRGMERWLRQELATALDIACRLEFPFPRQAFDGALAWLENPAQVADPSHPDEFWRPRSSRAGEPREPWTEDALAFRLIDLVRAALAGGDDNFAAVRRYYALGGDDPANPIVSARELTFVRQVAAVLDRLMHDRAEEAATWQDHGAAACAVPGDRWLATLLQQLGRALQQTPSPAQNLARALERLPSRAAEPGAAAPLNPRTLHVFGASSLGPGDQQRLAAIAEGMTVHLYLFTPTYAEGERVWQDHPILSALGGPSRDMARWLAGVPHRRAPLPPVLPPGDSALHHLQRYLLVGGCDDRRATPDDSLAFHAAHGPTRQVEVLRDELLWLFANDPALQPRDVLVMTPDLETFAPLLAGIFARRSPTQWLGTESAEPLGAEPARVPAIPTHIADLGLRQTNPLAEVLLRTLALAGERVTAAALLELLGLDPVRRRFGLAADDLAEIRDMVVQSGMRWGLDAADRALHGDQPPLEQNTVRFGLERLVLGALLPDDDPELFVLPAPGADAQRMALAPHPVRTRERQTQLGALITFVRTLTHHTARLRQPLPPALWVQRLKAAAVAMGQVEESSLFLQAEVLRVLDALGADAAGLELPLARTAVQRWLAARFEMAPKGDRPITGAVTVCALEPMRSVPFKVIALLGLDDGRFPRSSAAAAWDPFCRPRRGEHDRREIDRHLLLEAMLAAKEKLWLFWSGRDVRTDKELPASVPIEELLDVVAALSTARRASWLQSHPLQPWSERAFAPVDATAQAVTVKRSFDHGLWRGAQRLRSATAGARGIRDQSAATLPQETAAELPAQLSVRELARGLIHPQHLLLYARLGLPRPGDEVELPDREPVELSHLDDWNVRNRVLQALLAAGGQSAAIADRAHAFLAGAGELPLELGGRALITAEVAKAEVARLRLETASHTASATELAATIDGMTLTATLPPTCAWNRTSLVQWPTASASASDALQLEAWLTLLLAAVSGEAVALARIVGTAPEEGRAVTWFAAPDASVAAAMLRALLAVWRAARNRPLALFPTASRKVAELLVRGGNAVSERDVLLAFAAAWEGEWAGGGRVSGDAAEPAIAQLFAAADPEALAADTAEGGFRSLLGTVWTPLLVAQQAGTALAKSTAAAARGQDVAD